MRLLRWGTKPIGKEMTLHQWANDWVTAKETARVFDPTRLLFTDDEVSRLRESQSSVNVGHFWTLYQLRKKEDVGWVLIKDDG
jgi:hypothetical protein